MNIAPSLIRNLLDPAAYDHPVAAVELLETHISWLLLTGEYAYKIKKPVDFGFLDFSTLAQRRHYCQEELRLNRRLAPALYLAVVAITGSPAAPRLSGPGSAIEYAVKMRQFSQESLMTRVLARGRLQPEQLDTLAGHIAAFHAQAECAGPDSPYGTAENVWQPVAQNFAQIRPHLSNPDQLARLQSLQEWSEAAYHRLRDTLAQRKAQGFIRECHGDLHLGNMVLLDGRITPFDCLEFNAGLRWIDVMSEVAFLTMDLHARGHPALAHRFLNRYCESSGDYSGLRLLRFYQVYRALVRAKVACLRLTQSGLNETEAAATRRDAHRYLALAQDYTRSTPRPLLITHGLSGSGKTHNTQDLVETHGAVRIRSDVERKRLFGLPPGARSHAGLDQGLYRPEASRRTYERLAALAQEVLEAGLPVIVDATFLKREQRAAFRALARRLGLPFIILDFQAPPALLRQRIKARAAAERDASEATVAVLERQLATAEPLGKNEADQILTVTQS